MPQNDEELRVTDGPISARLAADIVKAIRSGTYPVGSRLPGEMKLAAEFGVSRPSMREALSAVQFAGYIESSQGAGYQVISRAPTLGGGQEPIAEGGLAHDALSLLEARVIVEPRIVSLAAFDPHPVALSVAGDLIEGMRLAVGGAKVDAVTDLRVHAALIEICRNPYLVRLAKQLLTIAASPTWSTARTQAWANADLIRHWADQHWDVYVAIRERQPAKAEQASRDHLLSVVRNALDEPSSWSPTERRLLETLLTRFGAGAETFAAGPSAARASAAFLTLPPQLVMTEVDDE